MKIFFLTNFPNYYKLGHEMLINNNDKQKFLDLIK